jgi:hypothetical protein
MKNDALIPRESRGAEQRSYIMSCELDWDPIWRLRAYIP